MSVLSSETAYCDQCRTVHWITDVISDTFVNSQNNRSAERAPEGTRLRRVKFECGNTTNVISRFVPRG